MEQEESHSGTSPGLLRDPQHTISIRLSRQAWKARHDQRELASSDRALVLSEKGYRDVIYFPPEHVFFDELRPSDSESICPFKGTANYYTLADGETDVAWVYPETYDAVSEIAGYLAFYPHSIKIEAVEKA